MTKVWDPLLRMFHWATALLFLLNALAVDDDSKAHPMVGYVLAGLLAFRVFWGLFGPATARFSAMPLSVTKAWDHATEIATQRNGKHKGHSPLGSWMVLNLLAGLSVICLTGHLMTTDRFWGSDGIEELHEAAVVWVGLSVCAHVIAVLLESHRTGINLPWAMISGYKRLDSETGGK